MKDNDLMMVWGVPIFILIFALFAYALDEGEERANLQEEQMRSINPVRDKTPKVSVLSEDRISNGVKEEQEILLGKEAVSTAEQDLAWAWGDVISIDLEGLQFRIRYFDYEKEAEKELSLFVDEKTVFENIEDLGQMQVQDSVSVDYIETNEGKNIARLISVDKN